jgi:NAD(P)-dependent dehydrogenase (short-subunit alcohol dehydrogenase family)
MKQTILITGASTGIGKATALFFADKGWQVAATMRNTDGHDDLASNPNIKLYALDVTDAESVKKAVKAAIEDLGRIDVLLNNAGYGIVGPVETAGEEEILKQFNTNLFGVFRVIQAVLPGMKEQKNGVIINVTSIGGLVAFPFNSLYHTTKFGLDGFSESIKYELKPFGIKVKTVAPGSIATDFATRSLHTTIPEGQKTDYDAAIKKVFDWFQTQINNASQPKLVAEVIYQAATDGTDKLRYLAGKDAEATYAKWKEMDNEAFFTMINSTFGLE